MVMKLSFVGKDDIANLPPGDNGFNDLSSKNSEFALIGFSFRFGF